MKNPFQYLQDRCEAEEAERKRKKEALQKEIEQREQLHQERIKTADQYHEMVTGVLKLLREVEYTGFDLRATGEAWILGYESSYRDLGYVDTWWESRISVRLEFDKYNQPTYFECKNFRFAFDERRGRWQEKSVRCGLTESELIDALKKLHP